MNYQFHGPVVNYDKIWIKRVKAKRDTESMNDIWSSLKLIGISDMTSCFQDKAYYYSISVHLNAEPNACGIWAYELLGKTQLKCHFI